MSYIVYNDPKDVAKMMFLKLIGIATLDQPSINICLSGGETPKYFFELVAREEKYYNIFWEKIHFWWCDERCVNINNSSSNFGEAARILFNNIKIPRDNLHYIDGSIPPEQSVLNYIKEMKKNLVFKNRLPCFDWLLLGMGDDGHVASIFVDGVSLTSDKWADVAEHPINRDFRITLTMQVINNASSIDFVVTGSSKSDMVKKVLLDFNSDIDYPARLVNPISGDLQWHLDKQASLKL